MFDSLAATTRGVIFRYFADNFNQVSLVFDVPLEGSQVFLKIAKGKIVH